MHGLLHTVLSLPKMTESVVHVGLDDGCRKDILQRLDEIQPSSLEEFFIRGWGVTSGLYIRVLYVGF